MVLMRYETKSGASIVMNNPFPIGILCNSLAIAIGGLIGAAAGGRLSQELKDKLNMIFSLCAMGMGVTAILLMENMPAVILALILGTLAGVTLHLGARIEQGGRALQRLAGRLLPLPSADEGGNAALLLTTIVLFCSSGTGIYGAIVSGMSGDHSILISKAILDLFTALIFACSLGAVVSLVAVPQLVIFLIMFFGARLFFPMVTPAMINDFKACGGFIMLATGFRIAKLRDYPIADMIPAMLLVWPISWAWVNWVLPLLAH